MVEIYTLQVLPEDLRRRAIEQIAELVADGGSLLVITRAREDSDPTGDLPWPLTRKELGFFEEAGLRRERFVDFVDDEQPPVRRFFAVYTRRA